MSADIQKQLARQRRERKFRVWLATMSWGIPVIAFGSFFSVWHAVSSTVVAASTTSKTSAGVSSDTNSVLFKIESSGPQVSAIQEWLSQLGYFNHAITQYYDSGTAQAVKSFQSDYGLPTTGEIDQNTLNVIQTLIRQNNVYGITQSTNSDSYSSGNGYGSNGNDYSSGNDQGWGSSGFSQQQVPPATVSSAS